MFNKKYKNKLPITISLSKKKLDSIAEIPRVSLRRFKENIADINDLINIYFRINVGLYLAKKIYEKETADSFELLIYQCKQILERYIRDKLVNADQTEIIDIENGLDAVDQMHTENIRRYLLEAYYLAKNEVVKLKV